MCLKKKLKMKKIKLTFSLFLFLLLSFNQKAYSDTFVFPNILEPLSTISIKHNTLDTSIIITNTPGHTTNEPTGGASLDLYLFDKLTGLPLMSVSNNDVCNPCVINLSGSESRRKIIKIEDLINQAGGISSPIYNGYGFLTTDNGNLTNFEASGFVKRTRPDILTPFYIFNADLKETDSEKLSSKTFLIPFITETPCATDLTNATLQSSLNIPTTLSSPGSLSPARSLYQTSSSTICNPKKNKKNLFDTTIHLLNTTGINESTLSMGFKETTEINIPVELYLFSNSGDPLKSDTNQNICNPCNFTLGTNNARKISIILDELITKSGGFSEPLIQGYGLLVVKGDASSVNIQSFVVNAKNNPKDLSVFGFIPETVSSSKP